MSVPVDVLESYVGRYALQPGVVAEVTLEDGRLFAEAPGQPQIELVPTSETRFILPAVGVQVTFARSGDGRTESLTLHQGPRDTTAPRVE